MIMKEMMKWQNLILWLHFTRFMMLNSVRKILISHQLPFHKCFCFPVGKIILVKTFSQKNTVALLDSVIATTDKHSPASATGFFFAGPSSLWDLVTISRQLFLFLDKRHLVQKTPHFPYLLIIDIISVLGSHGAVVPGLPAYSSRYCR